MSGPAQPFRVADLVADGKVVFLEPMAIWCSKCKDQQRSARDALAGLDPEEAVWIGLDVELSESAANLAKYADLNDFPFSVCRFERRVVAGTRRRVR